jgi:hypothetical protein
MVAKKPRLKENRFWFSRLLPQSFDNPSNQAEQFVARQQPMQPLYNNENRFHKAPFPKNRNGFNRFL